MKCPKCGNEMIIGEISVDAFSRGIPSLYWAEKDFFNKHMAAWVTSKKAVAEGGMKITIGNGMVRERTTAYACKSCNCVLICQ